MLSIVRTRHLIKCAPSCRILLLTIVTSAVCARTCCAEDHVKVAAFELLALSVTISVVAIADLSHLPLDVLAKLDDLWAVNRQLATMLVVILMMCLTLK